MSLYLIYTYNIYKKRRRRGGKGWKMLARAIRAWKDRRIRNATPGSHAPALEEVRRPLE